MGLKLVDFGSGAPLNGGQLLQRAAGNCAATPKKSNKTKSTNTTPETEKKAGIYGLSFVIQKFVLLLKFSTFAQYVCTAEGGAQDPIAESRSPPDQNTERFGRLYA